jgi:hypothetical protein
MTLAAYGTSSYRRAKRGGGGHLFLDLRHGRPHDLPTLAADGTRPSHASQDPSLAPAGAIEFARAALELAGGGALDGEDAWESARCSSPIAAKSPFA